MPNINDDIEKVAKDLSNLAKEQQIQQKEYSLLLKTINAMGKDNLKKSIKNMSEEQKKVLKDALKKADDYNWSNHASFAPRHLHVLAADPLPTPLQHDQDALDEELMNMANTEVKHQGDNEPKGFDGQKIADPMWNEKAKLLEVPRQSKNKEPRPKGQINNFPEYKPSAEINLIQALKEDKAGQVKDDLAQEDGHYRQVPPVKNEVFDHNHKVRKEAEERSKKERAYLGKTFTQPVNMMPKQDTEVDERYGAGSAASFVPAGSASAMGKSGDDAADISLAEKIEKLVMDHMREHRAAEVAEGDLKPGELQKHAAPGVNEKKFDRCVDDIKAENGKYNPYAVCNASLKKCSDCGCSKCMGMKKTMEYAKQPLQQGLAADEAKSRSKREAQETPMTDAMENLHDKAKADLMKDNVEFAGKPKKQQLSPEEFQHEVNKYRNFEDQKSEYKKFMEGEPKEMKKSQEFMAMHDQPMVNPQMPVELKGEAKVHEDNKYKQWEEGSHPEIDAEYRDLEDLYKALDFFQKSSDMEKCYDAMEKAHELLTKKYMGFKKLTSELKEKKAEHPKALAAWIGRKKYGKKHFQEMAHKSMPLGAVCHQIKEHEEQENVSKAFEAIEKAYHMMSKAHGAFSSMVRSLQKAGYPLPESKRISIHLGKAQTRMDNRIEMQPNPENNASVENRGGELRNTSVRKAEQDFVGHEPKKMFDKEANALVVKSQDMKKAEAQYKQPLELDAKTGPDDEAAGYKKWGQHWGFDWDVKEVGKTSSGKPVYLNAEHPKHSGFSSSEHQEAQNILARMAKDAPKDPLPVESGGMSLNEVAKNQIQKHRLQQLRKQASEKAKFDELMEDLDQPSKKMSKSVKWGKHIPHNFSTDRKTGRNYHVPAEKEVFEYMRERRVAEKTTWTPGVEGIGSAALKKSSKDVNYMIENKLDRSADQIKKSLEELGHQPFKAFTVKSFSDEEMLKSFNDAQLAEIKKQLK